MPKAYPRSLRIAQQIQRELADLLRFELKDPRVDKITITAVEVATNCAHAKVYFTKSKDSGSSPETIIEGLQKAKGFLRSQLAKRIKIRVIPELHFAYDSSIEHGANLSQLIDKAVANIGNQKTSK